MDHTNALSKQGKTEAVEISDDNDYKENKPWWGRRRSGAVMVKKPRGGERCIYMDSEEVKACRELGFELEREKDEEEEVQKEQLEFEYPPSLERIVTSSNSSLSRQFSSTSASSGANSPIAGWRISSPGDDPRDVKARLKVWAQAVAMESTSYPS